MLHAICLGAAFGLVTGGAAAGPPILARSRKCLRPPCRSLTPWLRSYSRMPDCPKGTGERRS